MDERERVVEFWKRQRAAMEMLKVGEDSAQAIPLFHAALELNPEHQDSLYYLAQCLLQKGDPEGALAELRKLIEVNPRSHRGYQQWGTIRALYARSTQDLETAGQHLERAFQINPHETGALLALGEVLLIRGEFDLAERHFVDAYRTNPRAAAGFFFQGYLAWKRGEEGRAKELLEQTRVALGKDWHPEGTTGEGDTKRQMHVVRTPLSHFWQAWNGECQPAAAFAKLEQFLQQRRPGG